jgi:hypothetical protein
VTEILSRRIGKTHSELVSPISAQSLCFVAVRVLLLPLAVFPLFAQLQNSRPTLRSVREIWGLNSAEAKNAYAVHLEGVVTYSDAEWGLLFIADETGAIYINTHGMGFSTPAGSRIHVDAVTGPGDIGTVIVRPNIHVLGQGSLPPPERRSLTEINTLTFDSHFVETHGVLAACDQPWARICFRIVDGKVSALVVIPIPNNASAQRLVGASVQIRGVSGVHLDPDGKPLSAMIFVSRLEDIKVEGGATQALNAVAVIVNKTNPVNNLSMAELKEILLGERLYWRGTQEISLLLPSPGSPDREIALSVLHMDDSSYERYWSERRSSGKAGHAPAAVSSTGVAAKSGLRHTRGNRNCPRGRR